MADKTNDITKMEGVRRALKQLGKKATASDIQDYVKKEFSMEMSRDHIYVARGQVLRQQAKRKAAARKEANGGKATAAKARPGRKKGRKGSLSKLEGVRRALAKLGKGAGSEDIQNFLKTEFDLDMNRERITKYKSLVLTKAKKARKKAAKARKEAEGQAQPAMAPAAAKKSSGLVVPMETLETVKELVKRVGPDGLQNIIDLLGR